MCRVCRALNCFKGLWEILLVFGYLSMDISRDISDTINSNICCPASVCVSPVILGYQNLFKSKMYLIAMLSRVPLFWLSHKFLCGFTASKHLEEMETDLSLLASFLFFRTGRLPSNLFWEVKNWVDAQFSLMLLSKAFFQYMQMLFQLWNKIFLGCILFLPWHINGSVVTAKSWRRITMSTYVFKNNRLIITLMLMCRTYLNAESLKQFLPRSKSEGIIWNSLQKPKYQVQFETFLDSQRSPWKQLWSKITTTF